ncbi:MAG: hypothetical protein DRP03_02275 [Candidatus Aenigmatarchaeota archaeon]|nr:MAG: hypothetical protein DRP03_02275 [Candidatus Aenigmarchaeota archaeon]
MLSTKDFYKLDAKDIEKIEKFEQEVGLPKTVADREELGNILKEAVIAVKLEDSHVSYDQIFDRFREEWDWLYRKRVIKNDVPYLRWDAVLKNYINKLMSKDYEDLFTWEKRKLLATHVVRTGDVICEEREYYRDVFRTYKMDAEFWFILTPEDVIKWVRNGYSIPFIEDFKALYKKDYETFKKIYYAADSRTQEEFLATISNNQSEFFINFHRSKKKKDLVEAAKFDITKYIKPEILYLKLPEKMKEVYKNVDKERQLELWNRLAKIFRDRDLSEFLNVSKFDFSQVEDIKHLFDNYFDIFKEFYKNQSAEEQAKIWKRIYMYLDNEKEKEILLNSSFDLIEILTPEEIYEKYWYLVKDSEFFQDDENVKRFYLEIAFSPRIKKDLQKDKEIDEYFKEKNIDLSCIRMSRALGDMLDINGFSYVKLKKKNENINIEFDIIPELNRRCVKIYGLEDSNLYKPISELVNNHEIVIKHSKLSPVKGKINIFYNDSSFKVEISFSSPLISRAKDIISLLSSDNNVKELLLTGKYKELTKEIREILEKTGVSSLENSIPEPLYIEMSSVYFTINDVPIYCFSEKQPLTICFGDKEVIPLDSYIIRTSVQRKEDIIDTLVCADYLKWNEKKIEEKIKEEEDTILRECEKPETIVERNRLLSRTYENSPNLKRLYYYKVSLKHSIPRSLDFDSDWDLLDITTENEMFLEILEKLKSL